MSCYLSPPIPPLSEEERKNPYAKFYDIPIQEPPAWLQAYFQPGCYMPQENALNPTEAIRIREGQARIDASRCIDCGECIKVCTHKAKRAVCRRSPRRWSGGGTIPTG